MIDNILARPDNILAREFTKYCLREIVLSGRKNIVEKLFFLHKIKNYSSMNSYFSS